MHIKNSLDFFVRLAINQLNLRQYLLRQMPKNSVCAEIGVFKGEFTNEIIRITDPRTLHLIDPWEFRPEREFRFSMYGAVFGQSQQKMDTIFQGVVERFANEGNGNTVRVHRNKSQEISSQFEDGYFDWIYIDGGHSYEDIYLDLSLYYPKVKPRGFLCGDDYVRGGWWQGGVKKAVDRFVEENTFQRQSIKWQQFILQKK